MLRKYSTTYAQRLSRWADGLEVAGQGKNMIAVYVVDDAYPITKEVAEWVWDNRRGIWDGQPELVAKSREYAQAIRQLSLSVGPVDSDPDLRADNA